MRAPTTVEQLILVTLNEVKGLKSKDSSLRSE